MKQDEIIRMAREAGMTVFVIESLERFAALVAAHEREKLMNVAIFSKWYQELDAAVLAEREACAKVCEGLVKGFNEEADNSRLWCAAAIRSRSSEH